MQTSVRDRSSLFFQAPTISGPPSYGGVPKEVYTRALSIASASFVATLVIMLALFVFTGVFLLRAVLAPVLITIIAAFSMLVMTKKRRDVLSILRESRQFEKEDRQWQ